MTKQTVRDILTSWIVTIHDDEFGAVEHCSEVLRWGVYDTSMILRGGLDQSWLAEVGQDRAGGCYRIRREVVGGGGGGVFVFSEDTDWETGHGDGGGMSYAWINYKVAWLRSKSHLASDRLRTDHMVEAHRGFLGCDDMEGHFAFNMSPQEMIRHLTEIGIQNTADLVHPADDPSGSK